jgi:hypothetical protein
MQWARIKFLIVVNLNLNSFSQWINNRVWRLTLVSLNDYKECIINSDIIVLEVINFINTLCFTNSLLLPKFMKRCNNQKLYPPLFTSVQ